MSRKSHRHRAIYKTYATKFKQNFYVQVIEWFLTHFSEKEEVEGEVVIRVEGAEVEGKEEGVEGV